MLGHVEEQVGERGEGGDGGECVRRRIGVTAYHREEVEMRDAGAGREDEVDGKSGDFGGDG